MDFGVIMHKSAKPSRQCVEADKEANSTVGTIRRKKNLKKLKKVRTRAKSVVHNLFRPRATSGS